MYHNRFFLALTVDKNTTKFKEWLDIASLVELKPNTDVIDVLGYFAYETVREVGHSLTVVHPQREWWLPYSWGQIKHLDSEINTDNVYGLIPTSF